MEKWMERVEKLIYEQRDEQKWLTASPVVGSIKSAQYPAVHRAKHISLAPLTNCREEIISLYSRFLTIPNGKNKRNRGSLYGVAGLCPVLLRCRPSSRSSVWPSPPWWRPLVPRGTSAPVLRQACWLSKGKRCRTMKRQNIPLPFLNSSGQELIEQSVSVWVKYCSACWTLVDKGPNFPCQTNKLPKTSGRKK